MTHIIWNKYPTIGIIVRAPVWEAKCNFGSGVLLRQVPTWLSKRCRVSFNITGRKVGAFILFLCVTVKAFTSWVSQYFSLHHKLHYATASRICEKYYYCSLVQLRVLIHLILVLQDCSNKRHWFQFYVELRTLVFSKDTTTQFTTEARGALILKLLFLEEFNKRLKL